MEKYSCSYGNTMSNFVFQNIEKLKDVKYDPEYDSFFGVYCVIQNIIQRGTPSQPSQILIKKLGNLIIDKNSIIPLIKNNNPEWINTIKGDGISLDNPAEIFYDTIYPKYMKDYAFTKQLILPEAKFSDIIEDSKVEFAEQQVDFYLPQANLVIEVDGESHGNYNQINKDKIRDKTLLKSNIKVIRINTYDIKNKTTNLQSIMKNIYSIVAKCEKINEYKEALEHNERYDLNLKYDIIIRFQILLLSLLKLGKLKITDIKWKFNIIKTDYKNISRLIELAYEDIKKWINVITKLLKVNYVVPNLEVFFGEDESGINIDFSIYKRWTDENILNEKCIYIRNDYYDNKNYFKLSTTNILEYKIKLGEQGSDIEEFGYILKNLFGFDQFRDGQLPIIINILEKNDTIGILPTGTGKSLCYQFVSMLQPGVSIVVAPIISLMMDQKENMDAVGMTRTAYIASNLNSSEKDIVLNQFKEGKYGLIWISPERFQNEKFRNSLSEINRKRNFALAVIDEVHCLSEWGHDFRTSYLTLIRTITEYCPEARLLGLTATASQAVLEDLKNEFGVDGSNVKALGSMNRDELVFLRKNIQQGMQKNDILDDVFSELNNYYGKNVLETDGEESICGLVFTPTKNGKNGCNNFAYEFERLYKKKIGIYHGDLSSEERKTTQNDFINNKYNILTSTKAFGMGINKKNIKYTIHYGIPQSIESFYQEAGRAGRDDNKEEKSFCYILYKPETCTNEILEKIFSSSTSINERKDLCKKELHNDLSTIMFLWNKNRYNVDEEYNIVRDVLMKLYKGTFEIPFEGNEKSNIELALYKLSILGIVTDWTIEYQTLNKGIIVARYVGVDENSIKERLIKYIRKYDVEFRLDSTNDRYKKYYDLSNSNEKTIAKYVKILLTWSNDNILYQRLQSTLNMVQLCNINVSDEDFRRKLDYYFRYSEITVVLENIAYHPKNYKSWFDIFYNDDKYLITKEKADNALASLQRYLESYRNNTGLNFIYGMLRLFSNQYSIGDEKERLEDSFNNIKEMDSEMIEEIINKTLEIGKAMDKDSKYFLSEMVCTNFPNKSRETFNQLNDDYSLCIELENSLNKYKNIMEDFTWDL